MRKALGFFLLLSFPLFGQGPGYTWSVVPSLVDNTPNCATFNCLTAIAPPASGGPITEIKAGYDGTIYALDNQNPYTFAASPGTWTEVPSALQTAGGNPITHISVGSASQVLALSSAPLGTSNVFTLNAAGTAWTAQPEHLSTAEIGADGTIVGTDPHHDTYAYINGAWTELSTTDTPSIYAVVNANMIWGVSRTGAIESWNGAGWTALSPAPSFTTSQAVDALAAGENYLAAIDTSGGIHVLNSAGSGVWSTISGTASSITGGGAFLFTDNSSGAVSHVNLVVPAIEVSASGQWPCPFSVYTCDASAVHTLTATAQFGGKGGLHGPGGISAVASTFMVGPTNPLATANAFETAVLCDPLTNPTAPECQPGGTGDATCSEAGLLQSGGIPSLQFEGALTQAFWLGTPAPACSTGILGTKCIYAVRNDCTAATTPPDLSMAFVNSGNYVGIATYITWMNAALCVRTNAGGPWACFLPLSFINGMNVALPQYSCTYNP